MAPRRKPRRSITARIVAPLAIVAAAFAIWTVVHGGVDDATRDATVKTVTTKHKHKKPKKRYTVKRGDTLGAIAERYNMSTTQIEDLNNGLDASALRAGEVIRLRK
jgi:LysM repeat protein